MLTQKEMWERVVMKQALTHDGMFHRLHKRIMWFKVRRILNFLFIGVPALIIFAILILIGTTLFVTFYFR